MIRFVVLRIREISHQDLLILMVICFLIDNQWRDTTASCPFLVEKEAMVGMVMWTLGGGKR